MIRPRVVLASLAVGRLLAAGCSSSSSGTKEETSPFAGVEIEPAPMPSFVLHDTEGREYAFDEDATGKVTYLFFGYTSCPDVCPVHLSQLAEVLDRPESPRNVRVVFVSVDPERDTPEVIRRYLDNFSTDFVGLTGTLEELSAAQEEAGVPVAVFEEPDPRTGFYEVGHAAQVLAYAPNGLGYVVYPNPIRQSMLAQDLPLLSALRDEGVDPSALLDDLGR